MDKKFICPAKLSRANWLGSDTYGDSFSIEADKVTRCGAQKSCSVAHVLIAAGQDTITVTRTDAPGQGWGMNPIAKCCTA